MGTANIGHIGFGKQSAYGTPVAITNYVEALSENLTLSIDRFDMKNIVGTPNEPDDMAGLRRMAGDIVFPADPTAVGLALRGIFGVMSGSVVLSGFLFKNEFTAGTSDFSTDSPTAPYTIEIFRDVTSSHRYADAVFSRLSFAIQPNQDLRCSLGMITKTTSIIAKSSPTYPGSPVNPFAFDTASLSIGGSASSLVEALTVTIDQNIEGVAVINASTEIARVRRRGPQTIMLSGTIGFDNLTEYTNFVSQTEQRFFLNVTRAASFAMLIDLPRVVYTTFPLGMSGRSRITAGFEAKARYHTGSATAIKIDLTSTKSNY